MFIKNIRMGVLRQVGIFIFRNIQKKGLAKTGKSKSYRYPSKSPPFAC